jgi:hypothetical protein
MRGSDPDVPKTVAEFYQEMLKGSPKKPGKVTTPAVGPAGMVSAGRRVRQVSTHINDIFFDKNLSQFTWLGVNVLGLGAAGTAVYKNLDDIETALVPGEEEPDAPEADTTDVIDLDPSEIRPNLEETPRTRNNILVIGDSTANHLLQNYSGKWQGYESDFAGKLEQYSITPQHSSNHGKAFGEKIQDHPVGRTKPKYGSNGLPGFSKHVVLGAGNTDQIYKFLEYKVNNKKEKFIVPKTAIIHMGYNDIGKTYDKSVTQKTLTNFQKTISLLKRKGVKDIRIIGPRVGNDEYKSPKAARMLYVVLRRMASQDPQVTFVHNELRNGGKTNPYPHMKDGVHYKGKSSTNLFNDALKGFNWGRGQPLPSTLHPTGYFKDSPGANKRVKSQEMNIWTHF